MSLYAAIDLHSRNSVMVIIDEQDRVVYEKRCPNDLKVILSQLLPYQSQLAGIAVESTFNWYWLVDGLMDAGYRVHLVNTSAVEQYSGLKYTNDEHDARWLAHLLRLGILPTGYIYPKAKRAVRDLLRKRSQLVRQRTAHILSIENLISRNTGQQWSGNEVKKLTFEDIENLIAEPHRALAIKSNLGVMRCLDEHIRVLEKEVKEPVHLDPAFKSLCSVPGIGLILGMTILLEAGDLKRFAQVGDFASYCRCVDSKKLSNNKKKGEGNRKNGNKYLGWAFVEAAHFALQKNEVIRKYYQRKSAKRNKIIAIKAVAHKLARASYHVMRNQTMFDVTRAFS